MIELQLLIQHLRGVGGRENKREKDGNRVSKAIKKIREERVGRKWGVYKTREKIEV